MRSSVRLLALSVAIALPLVARGQGVDRPTLKRALDSIVTAEMAARQWPSVAVLMVRGRDTIVNQAYGTADLELDIPARVDGIYWIGSVTKQFVIAAVLRLSERGALSMDDTVGRWLPAEPEAWRGTTMRQLAWHTSGIPSYTGQPRSPVALIRANSPVDSALALVRGVPFDFPRGSQMLYNNTGYVLLGRIIEEVTKKSLAEALREELFVPLGLTSMSYCSLTHLVANRVGGYARTATGVQRAILWWPDMAHGAGALCGTVGDLVNWSQALHGGKVLSPASYALMTAAGRLNDGTELRYAMGLLRTDVAGRRAFQHTGGIAGFTTWLAYLPDDSVHIAMTLNLIAGSERPSLAGVKLVERVLGRMPPAPGLPVDAATRAALVGSYGRAPRQVVIRDEGGQLTLQGLGGARVALVNRGDDRFDTGEGAIVRFIRSTPRAPAVRLSLDQGSAFLLFER